MLVDYAHAFPYQYDVAGERHPILPLHLANPEHVDQRITVDGHLDSGCTRSLFDGRLGLAIGLDPTRGNTIPFISATGVSIRAVLQRVVLEHPLLGAFELEVGFSQVNLSRNLLGRDFFALTQLGFREHRMEFYVTARA